MLAFLQEEYPEALPRLRTDLLSDPFAIGQ
jgi:hypothetical protein